MEEGFFANVAANACINLFSAVVDPLIQAWGHQDELNALRQRLSLAQALLSDAMMATTSTSTRFKASGLWLDRLADVVHNAENMLDEVNYHLVSHKIEDPNMVLDAVASTFGAIKLSEEIRRINACFDEVYRDRCELGLRPFEQLTIAKKPLLPQTTPTVDESEVVGREGDVSQLVESLCCSSSSTSKKNLSVVAVIGSGGLGKTTLARMVYKNDRIVKHFEERIWVTVSLHFDAVRILNERLQCLTGTNSSLTTIQALMKKLKECLKDKRLLLVLDDVWNKQTQEWDTLRSSLLGMNSFRDNKILITTRDREVALTMRSSFQYRLKTLSEADSWTLFRQFAFAEGGAKETEKLKGIGERIVRRCDGSPLAVKALGGLLYYRKSEREGLSIENNPR